MKSYLSRIVNRVSSIPEPQTIKPSGPVKDRGSIPDDSDPFEQTEEQLPEGRGQERLPDFKEPVDRSIIARPERRSHDLPFSSEKKTENPAPPAPLITPGQSTDSSAYDSKNGIKSAADTSDESKNEITLVLQNEEVKERPSLEKKKGEGEEDKNLKKEELNEPVVLREVQVKKEIIMSTTGKEKRANSPDNTVTFGAAIVPPYQLFDKRRKDTAVRPGYKKDLKKSDPVKPPVKIQPATNSNSSKFPLVKKRDNENRLVIGQLKVEVISRPETQKQTHIKTVHHVARTQRDRLSRSSSSLRFGLGQV